MDTSTNNIKNNLVLGTDTNFLKHLTKEPKFFIAPLIILLIIVGIIVFVLYILPTIDKKNIVKNRTPTYGAENFYSDLISSHSGRITKNNNYMEKLNVKNNLDIPEYFKFISDNEVKNKFVLDNYSNLYNLLKKTTGDTINFNTNKIKQYYDICSNNINNLNLCVAKNVYNDLLTYDNENLILNYQLTYRDNPYI